MRPPADTREWVSFADPEEDRTWLFDATFLLSGWECLYGQGCQGVLTAPSGELAQGCCSYGAHFTGEDDAARVEAVAARLPGHIWQFAGQGGQGGQGQSPLRRRRRGPTTTRLVRGACIFLNRPGFAAGSGCALHLAALADGVPPLSYKPDVCWQLPLRREDDLEKSGHVISRVVQWERRHWGPAGEEFAWWCSEDPAAYGEARPLYERMDAELRALCGDAVVELLRGFLRARYPASAQRAARSSRGAGGASRPGDVVTATVALPHPAVRRRD